MTTKTKPGPKPGSPSNNPVGRPHKGAEKRSMTVRARVTPTTMKWLLSINSNIADAIEQMAREESKK